jgi:hypothetical protein
MNTDEQLMTRWIDGDLSGDELRAFEERLETGELDGLHEDVVGHLVPGDLAASRASFDYERLVTLEIGDQIRTTLARVREPRDPERFNRGILERIRAEKDSGEGH